MEKASSPAMALSRSTVLSGKCALLSAGRNVSPASYLSLGACCWRAGKVAELLMAVFRWHIKSLTLLHSTNSYIPFLLAVLGNTNDVWDGWMDNECIIHSARTTPTERPLGMDRLMSRITAILEICSTKLTFDRSSNWMLGYFCYIWPWLSLWILNQSYM